MRNSLTAQLPKYSFDALNEYEERILAEYDYLDHDAALRLCQNLRQPVTLNFGSCSYEVHLNRPLAGETSNIFLYGFCTLFAQLFAAERGINRFLLISSKAAQRTGQWIGHILTASTTNSEEQNWFDFNGIQREEQLHREYNPEDYEYQIVDLDTFLKITMEESYRDNPASFLDPLEAEFTRIVVEMSAAEAGL